MLTDEKMQKAYEQFCALKKLNPAEFLSASAYAAYLRVPTVFYFKGVTKSDHYIYEELLPQLPARLENRVNLLLSPHVYTLHTAVILKSWPPYEIYLHTKHTILGVITSIIYVISEVIK